MLEKILAVFQQQCKLRLGDLLLVGVSGGPDSLCLLHVLHQLGFPIVAMYVNHKLRLEADAEESLVRDFATSLGVDFVSCDVNVSTYSHDHSVSVEESARQLRYQSLFSEAIHYHCRAVLVAHNADDQVETILLHLLRGAGIDGLRGMEINLLPNPWSEEIPLVRPFLAVSRAEILQYNASHGLNAVSDSSNLDPSYFRNRIRHELLPILESYNPNFRQALIRLSQSAKEDYAILQRITEDAWRTNIIRVDQRAVALSTRGVLKLPISIQRRLLRRAIQQYLPSLRDVDFECIERGLSLLAADNPYSQADLVAGMRLKKEGEQFWVLAAGEDIPVANYPGIPPAESISISAPGIILLGQGWQLQVEEVREVEAARRVYQENQDPYQVWLDMSTLQLPLTIRSRKRGDKITPLGMNDHTVKISDLMINHKVPQRARSAWPLVCSGDDIVWVPGLRLSGLAVVKPESLRIYHLKLFKVPAA